MSAAQAVPATVRLYEHLFVYNEEAKDYVHNPDSVTIMDRAVIEPSVLQEELGTRFQFVRNGYFITDPKDSKQDHLVINRLLR